MEVYIPSCVAFTLRSVWLRANMRGEERRGGKKGWYNDLVELISDEFFEEKKGGTQEYKSPLKIEQKQAEFFPVHMHDHLALRKSAFNTTCPFLFSLVKYK